MDAGAGMSPAQADARYQPQTVIQEVTPVNNQTIQAASPNGESILLTLEHTVAIAALTIAMPINAKLGQIFEFNTLGAVTALTLTAPNGTSIMNPPLQLAIGDYVSYRYTKTGVWMRRT